MLWLASSLSDFVTRDSASLPLPSSFPDLGGLGGKDPDIYQNILRSDFIVTLALPVFNSYVSVPDSQLFCYLTKISDGLSMQASYKQIIFICFSLKEIALYWES